ncbi:hypothetical protein [Streptomyces sp.]|uniref:hypothetical protein n=1 Tax=Streptomyces sp. TaxID=1931 RepID=UPI002D374429|nr:hypothetical protein [Streptomyces sp.]HZF92042.1 hypothetical protein [Streptomyces sp.]
MIAEAIDTLITLGWAALAWLTLLATVASILILAAAATGAWTARLAWRTARPAWARGRREARRLARRTRPDYEEAA